METTLHVRMPVELRRRLRRLADIRQVTVEQLTVDVLEAAVGDRIR